MGTYSLLASIGHTPLFSALRFTAACGSELRLLVKYEGANPGGSIKDRAALAMVRDAEQRGLLLPEGVIIEPTSGNTGIGLAMVAAQLGYKLILTMPDNMSVERRQLLASMGAQVVLTPANQGMQGSMDKAMLLAAEYPRSYIPNQFKNPANALAHYEATGPEIWEQTQGQVDVLVATVGTGGTISGCGLRLKELKPEVKVVAVEPAESPLLSEGKSGAHGIQGIGANFIPAVLNRDIIDRIVAVYTDEAIAVARRFAASEGLGCGISSGAALAAALKLADDEEYQDKTIVAILPDGSGKYMSTALFDY